MLYQLIVPIVTILEIPVGIQIPKILRNFLCLRATCLTMSNDWTFLRDKNHFRTNDVRSNKKAKFLAVSFASLAKEVKKSKLDVIISSIIPGNDNWSYKVMELNNCLKDLCESNDIAFSGNASIVIILLAIRIAWLVEKLLKGTG